jgi:N-hydroxyarylamine O-acetyltransferase
VLQTRQGDDWLDLYAFTLEPQYPVDFEMANHFVSTHPDSIFTKMLIVGLPQRDARLVLKNRELLVTRPTGTTTTTIESYEELLKVLEERFRLKLPAGTRIESAVGT